MSRSDDQVVVFADAGASQPKRKLTRSVHGCLTCRQKKVKCGEQRPQCDRCIRLRLACDYRHRQRKPYSRRRRAEPQSDVNQNRLASDQLAQGSVQHDSSPGRDHVVTGANPVIYECHEREAIDYYRSTITRSQHAKNGKYNVLSMIYELATKSDVIMHMVLAISRSEMLSTQSSNPVEGQNDEFAIMHYSSALRKVACYIDGLDTNSSLDAILVAVYLMLSYEQRFGDREGSGLSKHLKGLASIVRTKCAGYPLLQARHNRCAPSTVKTVELCAEKEAQGVATLFTIRMLEWICFLDAGASSFGLGGDFNAAVHDLFSNRSETDHVLPVRRASRFIDNFNAMQNYTNQLACRFWGSGYPSEELIDDISTHALYDLYGASVQLRYLISQLQQTCPGGVQSRAVDEGEIEDIFEEVYAEHREYFILADRLDSETGTSLQVIRDLPQIIPQYHAAFLFYLRCTAKRTYRIEKRQTGIQSMINLAFRAYQHGGDQAMLRIAWPLFMLVLETDDQFYREWSLTRLCALEKFGKNYSQAAAFAKEFTAQERRTGQYLSLSQQLSASPLGKFAI
jgi:hypothetical protein